MSADSQTYRSYLLRLWRVDEDGGQVWRASLEDPHTGERRGFANLLSLFDFLREQLSGSDENDLCEGGSRRTDTSKKDGKVPPSP